MSDDADGITLESDPQGQQYVLRDGDKLIGQLAYAPYGPDGTVRVLYHTEVDKEYGGRGLAARLAAVALDDAVAQGLTIVPWCPYIRAYVGKHPQYGPHAAPVTVEYRSVVPEEYWEA